jgi:hypothetical protein
MNRRVLRPNAGRDEEEAAAAALATVGLGADIEGTATFDAEALCLRKR